MTTLLDIIDVVITRDSRNPTRRGFGTALILAHHTAWPERVRTYADPADMIGDGFTEEHAAFKAALALTAQNPRVRSFKIGRRAGAPRQAIRYTPSSTAEGTEYAGRIAGEAWSFVVPAGASVSDVCAGIAAAINGLTVAATATATPAAPASTHVAVQADAVGGWFAHDRIGGPLALLDETPEPATGLASDLAAIVEADADWYALIVADAQSPDQIEAAATVIETQERIYVAHSFDADVPSSAAADIASRLRDASLFNTQIFFSRAGHGRSPDAAMLGVVLPLDPGSVQWQYKALATVPIDRLTETETGYLDAKHAAYYQRVGGLNVTLGGKTAGGEWADIMQSIHFLLARLREAGFRAVASPPKLPYTEAGIDVFKGAITGVLTGASEPPRNILDPESILVEAPTVAEVDIGDRAARVLPDVLFDARLQGAIVKARIRGTVRP